MHNTSLAKAKNETNSIERIQQNINYIVAPQKKLGCDENIMMERTKSNNKI
jgi:hypothetical protein